MDACRLGRGGAGAAVSREDWVRLTPAVRVEWSEQEAYLQAIYLHPRMQQEWTWDALITIAPAGAFRVVDLADLRVPPAWNGPYR